MSQDKLSNAEVHRITRVSVKHVPKICLKFKTTGSVANKINVVNRIVVPGELKKTLLSADVLVEMSSMGMETRCAFIREKYAFKIGYTSLAKFYRENGVRYGLPKTQSSSAFHRQE